MSEQRVAASAAEGSIYDLGYRHYEGRRLGRRYAFYSLFIDSLRSVWGFGRPTRAKAAPFIIVGLYSLPALFQLGFSATIASQLKDNPGSIQLFTYANYFEQLYFFMVLFCIAQAPELVCRDQRYHILPLYFTRSLPRLEYALARLAGLWAAIFLALAAPMVALFFGDLLMQSDMLGAIGSEWPKAIPALPAMAYIALGLAVLSLALSSFTPRRSYAAIGLVAYFLLLGGVPEIIYEVGRRADWTWASNLLLLRPISTLAGAANWLFDRTSSELFAGAVSNDAYLLASSVSIAFFGGLLLFRYRRVAA